MISVHPTYVSENNDGLKFSKNLKVLVAAIGVGVLLAIAILGLAIATLVKVNNKSDNQPATTTLTNSLNAVLAESVRIDDIMNHLRRLQSIATANNGNRAVTTSGFNETLNYITDTLNINTDFTVSKSFFPVRQFDLASDPILISSIDGVNKTYTYSTNISVADFYYVQFSIGANFTDFVGITVIPNLGCSNDDWQNANPPPAERVALVKRGVCAFSDKGDLAAKYNVAGLLIYNDGATPDRVSPIAISLSQENDLPALFLSFPVGQVLVDAAQNATKNTGVRLIINVQNLPLSPVGNICADTKTGDATRTIVIGSHTDSVSEGPGINDNGSGSAANLGLAIALARLYQTSTYAKYKYRVRFCWWGAEELGLLGSDYHVKQAKNSTVPGERLMDYLINLNYDMIGSPNFIFGIYDGRTASNDTPTQALPGSIKVTALFTEWFDRQKLPSTYTGFEGRSDYGPFLAEGIVASGLSTGVDDTKTQEERDYYDRLLGQGMGGIAGAIYDPCYHKACDSIENINVFGYEKMVQAAAYALEYLGRQDDLITWLYPIGRSSRSSVRPSKKKYNSIK